MFRLYDYSLIGRDGERARYPLWTVESRTTGDWRDRIVQRHPQLFRNERGRMPGYPQVGPGWAELIGLAVERIAKATRNGTAPVRIFEVKEKYGTLRLHTDRIDDPTAAAAVEEAIALAETRSACTCEVCGEEGGLYERGDVLATLCGRHARGVPVDRLGKHPHRACAEGRTHRFLPALPPTEGCLRRHSALRDRPEGFPPARRVMARPSRTRSAIRAPRKFSSSV